jgi:hypothetical protein
MLNALLDQLLPGILPVASLSLPDLIRQPTLIFINERDLGIQILHFY